MITYAYVHTELHGQVRDCCGRKGIASVRRRETKGCHCTYHSQEPKVCMHVCVYNVCICV